MNLEFHHRNYSVHSRVDQALAQSIVDSVLDNSVERKQVFRDDSRTLSARIRIDSMDDDLLLKIPRNRNRRRWERVLTFFRGSDVSRSLNHLDRMRDLGFAVPEPVLACEYRQAGMVVDSFLVYRYVEARKATGADAGLIISGLTRLERLGYVRTDAQLANFLIRGNEPVFIDFQLKSAGLLAPLAGARQLSRLIRSCPSAADFLPLETRNSFWLAMARFIEEFQLSLKRFKRVLRRGSGLA